MPEEAPEPKKPNKGGRPRGTRTVPRRSQEFLEIVGHFRSRLAAQEETSRQLVKEVAALNELLRAERYGPRPRRPGGLPGRSSGLPLSEKVSGAEALRALDGALVGATYAIDEGDDSDCRTFIARARELVTEVRQWLPDRLPNTPKEAADVPVAEAQNGLDAAQTQAEGDGHVFAE